MRLILTTIITILSLFVINCSSVEEKIVSTDNLKIDQPTLNVNITPYKIKAEFSNESVETTLSRNYIVGYSNNEGTNDNFFRRAVSFLTSTTLPIYDVVFFPFPHVRKFRKDLNEFIAGDKDMIDTAIAKAIRENNADGFYLTSAKITDSGILWFWTREATIQGKIIKFSPSK